MQVQFVTFHNAATCNPTPPEQCGCSVGVGQEWTEPLERERKVSFEVTGIRIMPHDVPGLAVIEIARVYLGATPPREWAPQIPGPNVYRIVPVAVLFAIATEPATVGVD